MNLGNWHRMLDCKQRSHGDNQSRDYATWTSLSSGGHVSHVRGQEAAKEGSEPHSFRLSQHVGEVSWHVPEKQQMVYSNMHMFVVYNTGRCKVNM